MAERLGLSGHDQLQHFVARPAWDDAPLWSALAQEADRLLGGRDAFLVIDDTALPKKGTLSAGVARQYCGQLGKRANCQSLVSLTLAQNEVPVMVGLRLFLPEEWSSDVDRCAQAGVPEACRAPKSKGQIALDELDRVQAAGARFGTVLADAGYGASAAFRHGLDERGLAWAVGIPGTRRSTRPTCSEWRSTGERKVYLSNLSPRISLRALAAAVKARWVCEQAHQQLKGELGLGHFEGRSWTGLHRHALMTCIAFAYLQHLRLAGQSRTRPGKNADPQTGTTTATQPARYSSRHHRQAVRPPHAACPMPALQKTVQAAA